MFELDYASKITPAALASVYEVGVGVNLALSLLDGVRSKITTWLKQIPDWLSISKIQSELLPLLEVQQTAAKKEVAESALNLHNTVERIQLFFAHEWLHQGMKLVSLLLAFLFVVALVATPFASPPNATVVGFGVAVLIGSVALWPFTAFLALAMIGVICFIWIWIKKRWFNLKNDSLIKHTLQEAQQLRERKIP